LCDGLLCQPQKQNAFIRREEVLEQLKAMMQRHEKQIRRRQMIVQEYPIGLRTLTV
jgi:hypothetical protein